MVRLSGYRRVGWRGEVPPELCAPAMRQGIVRFVAGMGPHGVTALP